MNVKITAIFCGWRYSQFVMKHFSQIKFSQSQLHFYYRNLIFIFVTDQQYLPKVNPHRPKYLK